MSLVCASSLAGPPSGAPRKNLRFGLVSDLHYANAPARGTRHYRDSLDKLNEAVRTIGASGAAFLVELGDLKDQDPTPNASATLGYLRRIEDALRVFRGPLYHVLGNHDLDGLSKPQVLGAIVNTRVAPTESFYTWVATGVRFVALDACFSGDGRGYDCGNFVWTDAWVPHPQLQWLEATLRRSSEPVIVCVHQRLDGDNETCVRNAADVRSVLERSGKVLAVFHGHHHPGAYAFINGIHYYTLRAMVEGPGIENNAYAVVDITAGKDLAIMGAGHARSMLLPYRAEGQARAGAGA